MIYAFGAYELDMTLYELRHAGAPCRLEPRVFNVLAYLIQHRAQVVPREDLLEALWPGFFNSVPLLNNCIMAARKAVGDTGDSQHVIQTIRGRGYRFIAPTTVSPVAGGTQERPRTGDVLPPLLSAPGAVFSDRRAMAIGEGPSVQDVLTGDQTVGTIVCTTWDASAGDTGDGRALQRLRQTFFLQAQQGAHQDAGTLFLFGTDGVLLLWTQEAHALSAVRAAFHLSQHMQEACRVVALPQAGMVRCGIHTGAVVVPHYLPLPLWTPLTMTESGTVAVWLHALAPPGTLLTSKATLLDIQTMVRWSDYGDVRIPGLSDPLMAYRLETCHAGSPPQGP